MMTIQSILKNRENYIVDEYKKGRGTSDLGKEFNCNPGTIWKFLKAVGVEIKKRTDNYGKLEDKFGEIKILFDQGLSCYKIGKKLNIAKCTILRILKKHGVDTSDKFTGREDKIVNYTQEIIEAYQSGINTPELTKMYNCGNSTIFQLLKKNNITLREKAKYNVNTTFFNKIDTPEKAYTLGWFYSDGCVDLSGKMRIQLQIEDKYILEQIAKIMEHDGIIKDVPPPKKFPDRKWQTCLTINRKELCDKLIELGCLPNKSLILKFPTADQVPDYLLSSFIRGFYDGDGGISSYTTSLTSTDIFLKDLALILKNKLGIDGQLYYRHADKNTATLMFSKKESSKKFLQWIYTDSTIHLTRKYEKAKFLLYS
jgi:Mor family transcriptional regulator